MHYLPKPYSFLYLVSTIIEASLEVNISLLASAPGDYTILSRTLTFGLITTRLLVVIDINNDDIVESIESFFVNLMLVSVGANVVVNTDRTEIRILDNDGESPCSDLFSPSSTLSLQLSHLSLSCLNILCLNQMVLWKCVSEYLLDN